MARFDPSSNQCKRRNGGRDNNLGFTHWKGFYTSVLQTPALYPKDSRDLRQ
jgi:hypothetical protein